jgi:hypothetical protein
MEMHSQKYTAAQGNAATYTIVTPYNLQMQCCMDKFSLYSTEKKIRVLKLMAKADKLSGKIIYKYPSLEEVSTFSGHMRVPKPSPRRTPLHAGSKAIETMSLKESVQHCTTPREASGSDTDNPVSPGYEQSNAYKGNDDYHDLIDSIVNRCNIVSKSTASPDAGAYGVRKPRSDPRAHGSPDSRMNSSRGMTSFKLQSKYPAQG